MTLRNESWSISRLGTFLTCPLQYWYTSKEAPVEVRVKEDFSGEAAVLGTRIHDDFQKYLQNLIPLPDDVAHLQGVLDSIRRMPGFFPENIEQEICLTKDMKPTSWYDAKTAWVRLKMDVLVLHDNMARVIDWKTGKRKPRYIEDYEHQLRFYALIVFELHPEIEEVRASLYWTQTKEQDKLRVTRDEMPEIWQHWHDILDQRQACDDDNNWPAKPGAKFPCPWCAAKDVCQRSLAE